MIYFQILVEYIFKIKFLLRLFSIENRKKKRIANFKKLIQEKYEVNLIIHSFLKQIIMFIQITNANEKNCIAEVKISEFVISE